MGQLFRYGGKTRGKDRFRYMEKDTKYLDWFPQFECYDNLPKPLSDHRLISAKITESKVKYQAGIDSLEKPLFL